jgi:hypothetical protein
MSLLRLLVAGAGAAYLYKRFVADSNAGVAETAAAEPFSSEQIDDQAEPVVDAVAATADAPKDTLEQPTWLDAADAPEGAAS